MPKIKKPINELNKLKSLCSKTIEEIESNAKKSILPLSGNKTEQLS